MPPDRRPEPAAQRLGLLATGNPTTRVVVGLGNAEREYQRTRHNLGAMAVARAVEAMGLRPGPGAIPIPASRSGFVLPSGFMNDSGGPVRRAVERWRPTAQGLLIVHDELDLPLGSVKLKRGGGEAGHNGLKSITAELGTRDYARLRVGVGRPGEGEVSDYLLAPLSGPRATELEQSLDDVRDAIDLWLMHGLEQAMNRVNRKVAREHKAPPATSAGPEAGQSD